MFIKIIIIIIIVIVNINVIFMKKISQEYKRDNKDYQSYLDHPIGHNGIAKMAPIFAKHCEFKN